MRLRTIAAAGWVAAAGLVCARAAEPESAATTATAAPSAAGLGAPSVNAGMPSWLKLGGEVRGRAESTIGLGYEPGDHDSIYLQRLRMHATVSPTRWLRMFVQVQDARSYGQRTRPAPATVRDPADVRLAYFEVGTPDEGWQLRAGRQPLIFGESRLVSTSNWGNVAPAFDAVRLSYRISRLTFDWFASTVVRPQSDHIDRPSWDRRLHGFYATVPNWRPGHNLEPYFFWKSDANVKSEHGAVGRSNIYTTGLRSVGKLPYRLDYNIELAFQNGQVAGDPVRAWATHWQLGYVPWMRYESLRMLLEYNQATGDRDSSDGKRGTFDHLYPTYKYATADNIAWRNIHELVVGPELKPGRNWKMRFAHRTLWLANRHDAVYTIFNTVAMRNPNATSAYIGQEADVRATWQARKDLQLMAGLGRVFPGAYLKQSTKGGSLTYTYIMWAWSF